MQQSSLFMSVTMHTCVHWGRFSSPGGKSAHLRARSVKRTGRIVRSSTGPGLLCTTCTVCVRCCTRTGVGSASGAGCGRVSRHTCDDTCCCPLHLSPAITLGGGQGNGHALIQKRVAKHQPKPTRFSSCRSAPTQPISLPRPSPWAGAGTSL